MNRPPAQVTAAPASTRRYQSGTRNGSAPQTTVTLTDAGREALGDYTRTLRKLLGGL